MQTPANFNRFLANTIREYMAKRNITVVQFAARAQMSGMTVEAILTMNREITVNDCIKVAKALECTVSQLFRVAGY